MATAPAKAVRWPKVLCLWAGDAWAVVGFLVLGTTVLQTSGDQWSSGRSIVISSGSTPGRRSVCAAAAGRHRRHGACLLGGAPRRQTEASWSTDRNMEGWGRDRDDSTFPTRPAGP